MLDQAHDDLFKTDDVPANPLSNWDVDRGQGQGTRAGLIDGRQQILVKLHCS